MINRNNNIEWYTPPELIRAMGVFDLDPCAPFIRRWETARVHYTKQDNGLTLPWNGRVWLNPPYMNLIAWMRRMALHNNGIALIFARTDTQAFHKYVFPVAASMLFMEGRVSFINVHGERSEVNGGAPSVLISYGEQNMQALAECGIRGKHVPLNYIPLIVVGCSPRWKQVITIAMVRLQGEGSLQQVYDLVERIAPDKIVKNKHYKAKVRQQLQTHFLRINKGYYSNKT